MLSSTEKFVFKKEGSVRKKTCDPADNVRVYRVIAAPGAYTAKHMGNGHFFISQEFKVAQWVSLSSLFFFWNFYVDVAQTSGDKWKKTTASLQSEESKGKWLTPTITLKCKEQTRDYGSEQRISGYFVDR